MTAVPELLHTITSGQSLSIGGVGTPALSTVSEEPNALLAASGGVLSALQSSTAQAPQLSMGYALARARPGQRLAFSTHGQGGRSIAQLSPGGDTGLYEQAIGRVNATRAAEVAAAGSYGVEALHWIQGEQDQELGTSLANYVASMVALRDAYRAGTDTPDLPMISSQTASWGYYGTPARIGLAQLRAARENDGIYIVGGQYQLPYIDGQHPTNVGYYRLGELHARAHQAVIDGSGWAPFAPISYELTPSRIDVRYHVPYGPLRFDTAVVPAQPHRGFSLSGTAAAITAVALVSADTVRLSISRPITESTAAVGYGVSSVVGGVGAGNLADSHPGVSAYDSAPLANWALHSLDPVAPLPGSVAWRGALYVTLPGGELRGLSLVP